MGCDGAAPTGTGGSDAAPESARPEPAGPQASDLDIVAAAVATHTTLLGSYRELIAAHPSTRPGVAVLVDQLGAHLSALGGAGSPTDQPARTSAGRTLALTRLRGAESRASADRLADCLLAGSGDLARVLASVAACHAQHVDVLDDLVRAQR